MEKGYIVVGDILNKDGELMAILELKDRGLRINFLDHFNIKKRTKDLQIVKQSPTHGPYIPRILFDLGIEGKGCRRQEFTKHTFCSSFFIHALLPMRNCIRWGSPT